MTKRSPADDLAAHYAALERRWQICDRSADYARLVVPAGNSEEPFHRWFRMKEAYSYALFERLLKDADCDVQEGITVLDPFVGSGTTLVSAVQAARQREVACVGIGVERNPVLRIVAAAKIFASVNGPVLAAKVRKSYPEFLRAYRAHKRGWRSLRTESVTLNNSLYFPPESVRTLLALGKAAASIENEAVRVIFQTAVAAAVEPAGKLRRDGRALRYTPERRPSEPLRMFESNLALYLEDMEGLDSRPHYSVVVRDGDARDRSSFSAEVGFDWVVFSPPYPNNIDYTEVYKAEAWVLGCFSDVGEMRSQRLRTLRSHTSLNFPDEYRYKVLPSRRLVDALMQPVLDVIPEDRYEYGRRQLVSGYADDMLTVLEAALSAAAPSGRLALVVGNSVHSTGDRRFVIAADVLLAGLAELAGWQVEEIRIARRLHRRAMASSSVRESVVVLRAPRSRWQQEVRGLPRRGKGESLDACDP